MNFISDIEDNKDAQHERMDNIITILNQTKT